MAGSTEELILDAQLDLVGNDVEAVRRAANELASIGVDALPTLIAALDEPRAAQHVHQAVIDAIKYFKLGVVAAPAIPSIMRYLNPDILHGGCTVEAACALASIGEPAVLPALQRFRIAKSEERKSFFRAFTRLECTLVAAPLIELLNESDGDLRLR